MIKKIVISIIIFLILLAFWYFGYYTNTPEYLIEKIKSKCSKSSYNEQEIERMTRTELKNIINTKCN